LGLNGSSCNKFIGTINDSDLVFKRNNIIAGKIGLDDNTSYGFASLPVNTTGDNNTAIEMLKF
jgi:hypothetical protein